ncbi:MAG: alpha/beta fold hydrolase [Acidimicrobiales bacterium]
MDLEIASGAARLAGYLANPPVTDPSPPTLVLCHGYPSTALRAEATNSSYPELADRIANEGWRVLTFAFRGCGASTGDFELAGWRDDVLAAAEHARTLGDTRGVWLAGFGTGGGLCISAAAMRPEILGVATLGTPADFKDWANHPRRLVQHARDIGAIHRKDFPGSLDQWARGLSEIRPIDDVAKVAPRPLLLLHGSDDESVPSFDARVLSDAHGSAELRIIPGAAHDLRHDPRAIAILLGWLDRERHQHR